MQRPPEQMRIRGVMESVLYCEDLAAARRFYGEVLGLPVVIQQEGRHVFFACGPNRLLVFNPQATSQEESGDDHVPPHGARGASHLALAVPEGEMRHWTERLRQADVAIERELSWPQGGHSLYFRDPAGNSLELVSPRVWGEDDGVFDACGVPEG